MPAPDPCRPIGTSDLGRLPDFVIAGAMRSGTTSLARYLGEHPQVYGPPGKEMHYFDRNYERGIDWYRSRFVDARPEELIFDATPSYMYRPEATKRMAHDLPGARILISLRNPIDRAYSQYWLRHAHDQDPAPSFAEALALEPERAQAGLVPDLCYLARSRYLGQLEFLAELYPRDRIHVLLFEDLIDQPAREYAAIARFLGIRDTYVPEKLGRQINAYQKLRSVRVRRMALGKPALIRNIVGRLNAIDTEYPPMDAELRSRLIDEFTEERHALERWLDRDLSIWAR